MNAADNPHLPRRAYIALALLAGVIGLASSVVTAQFFILGLQRIEPDALARDALIAAGVLMIVTELATFGLSALLPKARLRALRWRLMACGLALLAFEASTIYVTQVTLVKTGESAASATDTRIADLRVAINSRRAGAAALQANGVRQSDSIHGFNRQAGALALRESLDAENAIAPLATELAALEAAKLPTLTDVLGVRGMLAYTVARALLISVMGLVMFGAAGALLRAGMHFESTVAASSTVASTVASTVKAQSSTLPRWTSTLPKHGSTAYAIAAAPMGAIAAPVALYVPPIPQPPAISAASTVKQPAPAALAPTPIVKAIPEPVQARTPAPVLATVLTPEPVQSTVEHGTDARYEHIKTTVLGGQIKPTVRAIQTEAVCGTALARRYLQQLAAAGLIVPAGQGWELRV